jgi:YesN/AraC family two-component response regulator
MQYRVLIVDDEEHARSFLAALLNAMPHCWHIEEADSADEALRRLRGQHFHLLFADVDMPGTSGLDMLKALRSCEYGRQLCTVFISAHARFEYVQRALELGAFAYIDKPLHTDKVLPVVERYMQEVDLPTLTFGNAKGEERRIKLADLAAVESENPKRRLLTLYTSTDCYPQMLGRLGEVCERLPDNFIPINRRCVVNVRHVSNFCRPKNTLSLACCGGEQEFPVSRNAVKLLDIKGLFGGGG